jgi:sterol desaturase/sphingolipid hydroxylase (fatty acid hydroxylase superfamily)
MLMLKGLLTTMNDHSGYSIPLLNAINGDPRTHDFHHNAFRYNFGEIWMDR